MTTVFVPEDGSSWLGLYVRGYCQAEELICHQSDVPKVAARWIKNLPALLSFGGSQPRTWRERTAASLLPGDARILQLSSPRANNLPPVRGKYLKFYSALQNTCYDAPAPEFLCYQEQMSCSTLFSQQQNSFLLKALWMKLDGPEPNAPISWFQSDAAGWVPVFRLLVCASDLHIWKCLKRRRRMTTLFLVAVLNSAMM